MLSFNFTNENVFLFVAGFSEQDFVSEKLLNASCHISLSAFVGKGLTLLAVGNTTVQPESSYQIRADSKPDLRCHLLIANCMS